MNLDQQQPGKKIIEWKRFLWFLLIVAVGAGLLYIWLWYSDPNRKMAKEAQQQYQQYQEQLKRMEQEYLARDWGEKTPEETFDKFIGYLKVGDLESAVKYYRVGKQDAELERFKRRLESNTLQDFINSVENVRYNGERIVEDDEKIFYALTITITTSTPVIIEGQIIDVLEPGQNITQTVDFYKNQQGLWKVAF